jgi:hypothetical protein
MRDDEVAGVFPVAEEHDLAWSPGSTHDPNSAMWRRSLATATSTLLWIAGADIQPWIAGVVVEGSEHFEELLINYRVFFLLRCSFCVTGLF